MKTWDIIVIGAGPAGMSAAIEARRHSLSVLLLDEHAAAGGQIYKGIGRARPRLLAGLGPSYAAGREIVLSFETCGAVHVRGASCWHIDPDGQVTWSQEGTARQARAKRIIIATGAQERPFPIPGWTLPGVMSAGAAQIADRVKKSFPKADIKFAPDAVRSKIVDSWPEDMNDALARADWAYAPAYDFERAFEEYLVPTIRKRYS